MAIRWLADGSSIRNYVLPGPLSYSRMERHRPRTEDDSEPWIYSREMGRRRRVPLDDEVPRRPRPGGSVAAYSQIEDRLPDPADPDYFDQLLALERTNPAAVHAALGVPKQPPQQVEVRRLSVSNYMAKVRAYMSENGCAEEEALELVAKTEPGGKEALEQYMRG